MDYGTKGTLPGYDVNSVVDYLLSFNSSWPLLKVHDTNIYSGAVNHNLGYPPFFLITRNPQEFGVNDGRVDQFSGITGFSGGNFAVNSSVLQRGSGSLTPRYFIFRLDLTQNFTAPQLSGTSGQTSSDPDFGFKITKPGADINSTDMRDYALHSNARSPAVHMVRHAQMSNTGGGLGRELTVNHNLGYVPLAFVFILPGANSLSMATDRYAFVPPPVGLSGLYYTVNNNSVYVTAGSGDFSTNPFVSVVVLKDPFIKDVINITYP